jgi:hypothetical protein
MCIPRVYADFQNLDDLNRLRLTCAGTLRDLERQGVALCEGLALTLYTDDEDDQGQPDELRAEGVVQYESMRARGTAGWPPSIGPPSAMPRTRTRRTPGSPQVLVRPR